VWWGHSVGYVVQPSLAANRILPLFSPRRGRVRLPAPSFAGVAQSVERAAHNALGADSIPAARTS
jgi:hypothetical protein